MKPMLSHFPPNVKSRLYYQLIRAKLDTVDFPYEPQDLWEEADALQRVWTDDLRQLMRDVPPFDTMFRDLRALFEERMSTML